VILTVTPNPALDLTWRVARLTPGATHRVPTGSARAGGKGLNVARVLHGEGHGVLALAAIGGRAGAEFEAELEASGIPHRLMHVEAPTRRSVAVVDEQRGETSVLNELGSPLAVAEVRDLVDTAARLAREAHAVTVSGSLPPGLGEDDFERLMGDLVATGVPVVVDTSGPALLAAARAGAHALKPNLEELEATTGHSDPVEGANALLALGAALVIVSLGAEGLIVAGPHESPVHARLPRVLHGNATGAGDAAVAAIALELAQAGSDTASLSLAGLARRATAWSASAVLMPLAGELSAETGALADEVAVTPIEETP
jgi:1-phosphofructokinase family hexose kinase